MKEGGVRGGGKGGRGEIHENRTPNLKRLETKLTGTMRLTPRPQTKLYRSLTRFSSPGRSPRARTGRKERTAGDSGSTTPSPAQVHPGQVRLLRSWLQTGPTSAGRGVQGHRSAKQPLFPAHTDRVPDSTSPSNLPGPTIEDTTLEELCSQTQV